jgi:transglutaminase-like putative cysteine protease
MATLGLLSSGLVTEISSTFLFAAIFLVLTSVPVNLRGGKGPIKKSKTLWNLAAIGLFIYFSVNYLFIGQDLLASAARFLMILAAIKLFDLQSPRDFFIFYSLVFFQILSAAASSISPLFLLIISVFIISAIWAMIVFTIKGEYDSYYPVKGGADVGRLPAKLFPPSFFLATVALTFCSILITLFLFFLIPRVGIGFFDSRTEAGLKVSGFSEKISLGDFGAVKKDTTVVMRIELPGGPLPRGRRLYIRGQSLDTYIDSGWEATVRKKTRIWKKEDNRYVLAQGIKIGPELIEQRIMLEPLDTDVIFAAGRPVIIEGRFPTLFTNNSGSLYLPNTPYSRIEYTAFSTLNPRTREPLQEEADYLGISAISPGIIELARKITDGARDENRKALLIERYLKENYLYTLNPETKRGSSPLESFLLETKEGYCEHFATAMVLLLRATGVQARIVTGFLNGEWNEYGNYYLVRQQDAHSWVEARVDGYWTRLDPTPSVGLTGMVTTSTFSMYLDSLKFKWRRYIIRYSLTDQFKLGREVEARTNRMVTKLRIFYRALSETLSRARPLTLKELTKKPVFIGAILILIITSLLIFMSLRIGKGGLGKERGSKRKRPDFYLSMESYLSSNGIDRLLGETPGEFAKRTKRAEVVFITTCFEALRYGHRELTKVDRKEIEESLKRLKAS